jgi:hypothetical protein
MSLRDFSKEFGGGGKFIKISKVGKVKGFIHPGAKYKKRTTIVVPYVGENDKGESELRYVTRFYSGDSDPLAQFKIYLKETGEIDNNDIVLRYEYGGKTYEISKGDLLEEKGFNWQNRIHPRTEFLFNFINISEGQDNPVGPVVLPVPFSAGKKLKILWQEEFDEEGDSGDPWLNPYPFRVSYDSSGKGTDMYSVRIWPDQGPSDKVLALFDEDPVDLDQYTDPEQEDLKEGSTFDLLKKYCAVSCPLFDTDIEEENATESTPEPQPEPKAKVSKAKVKTTKPKAKKDKPTPPAKPSKPPKKVEAGGLIDVKDCVKGKEYIHDDDGDEETLTFVSYNSDKRKATFKDKEGDRVRLKAGVEVKVCSGTVETVVDQLVESEPDIVQIKVSDCEKGKWYYTEEGQRLRFKKYKSNKGVGVFYDEEKNRLKLKGDILVSEDVGDAAPLKSEKVKTASKEETSATIPDEKDDSEEVIECPQCGKGIPVKGITIYKDDEGDKCIDCPHCQAKLEVGGDDEDDVGF